MSIYDSDWYREQARIAKRQNAEHLAKFDRSFNGHMAKAGVDTATPDLSCARRIVSDPKQLDGGGVSDHHAGKVADLLVEAGSFPHRAAALQHLLHKPSGQALLQRMHKADQTGKESSMDKTFRDVVKRHGIVAVAKSIVDERRSYGLSEHEFVALATEHAKAQHPELTEAAAFSKMYQSEPMLRQACVALKSMPFQVSLEPLQIGGGDVNPNDPAEAIEQLKQLGRDRWPTASAADQFERALTSPEYHKLARVAVPIPQPTTSYQFPHR
jgi:hypothetical protein